MTSNKKRVFKIILAVFPLVFFLALELLLRLFGLFPLEPFIIEPSRNGKEVYQLNTWVAKRYFDPNEVSVPGLSPDVFEKHKSGNTFRIFCLGESTTAGFPFDCQVPFPKQLQYLLTQTYPEYQFEVINAGISAINSFTVVDLLPEILDHSPDLILIYLGHNEFYGAYGSASTVSLGQNDSFIRFYLKLQKLHLMQMLKRFVSFIGSLNSKPPAKTTLMASVIQDQSIPYGSEKYRRTLQTFQNNLEIILQQCAEKNVPVMIGNLVSNVRDLKPFASLHFEADEKSEYQRVIAEGDRFFTQNDFRASAVSYRKAFAIDSSSALLWYNLGRAYAALNDSPAASYYFYGAKDRDIIPFRAGEQINQLIAKLANAKKAKLVDMIGVFRKNSPQELIGNNIMVDHLHPNPNGYYLMARVFYDQIVATGFLKNRDTTFVPDDLPYYVTDLDWDIGLLKIFEMNHRWPFEEKSVTFADYKPYGDSVAATIARHYIFVENVWSRAHYKMAEEYLKRKEYEHARREYLAVSVFAPDDPYPYQEVARTYEMEGRWDKREAYLKKTLPLSNEKGMIQYQIAFAQYKQSRLQEASRSMLAALNYPDLDRRERQNALFYLAGFYSDAKDFENAKNILIGILQEDPNFQPARIFLKKLSQENG
jgi:lysophospholipase L1-like esterase